MKSIRSRTAFLVALLAAVLIVRAEASAGGPAELVTEMVVKIKALRNSSPVVDYVHWDTAFEGLSEAERTARGFRSSAEMRDYYFRMLSDPERFARQEIAVRASIVPPEKRAELERAFERSLEEIRASTAAVRERFQQIQFDVGEERIDGDTAQVMVATTLGGETNRGPVELIRKDGRWYLPSILFATTD